MLTGMNKYGKASVMQILTVYWALLLCFLWKRPFKRDFTDIYRITFFGDGNLGNTSTMRIIFFSRMFKI